MATPAAWRTPAENVRHNENQSVRFKNDKRAVIKSHFSDILGQPISLRIIFKPQK